MRRILVEYARRKQGPKRGGDRIRLDIDEVENFLDASKAGEILAVHDALDDLGDKHPSAAQLVKLRYFGGMTQQQAAECLDISRSTADRYWVYAKAALFYCAKGHGPIKKTIFR